VPKGLSSLIDAGAYRTRSVQLRKYTSQKTGRRYDWVVSGLAWLGGKMPAVRTLADVVKLYEDDDDVERRFVQVEDATVDREAEGFVDAAIARGAIPLPAREAALRLCEAAPAPFRALIDGRPDDLATRHANYWQTGELLVTDDERWLEGELRKDGFAGSVDDLLYGPPELRLNADDDAELAERKRVAREFGLPLEDVA